MSVSIQSLVLKCHVRSPNRNLFFILSNVGILPLLTRLAIDIPRQTNTPPIAVIKDNLKNLVGSYIKHR